MNASDQLKLRVLLAAQKESAPSRLDVRRRTFFVMATASLLDLAIFVFPMGGMHAGDPRHGVADRPLEFIGGTVLGWSLIAVVATCLSFTRRSMVGTPLRRLLALILATPLALFGWALLWSSRYPETMMWVSARPGLKCLSFTLAIAVGPLIALAYVRRERIPVAPAAAGASRGVALGALAGISVNLWCPIAHPTHVLIGHIGPIIVLMGIGALVGHVLTRVRAR